MVVKKFTGFVFALAIALVSGNVFAQSSASISGKVTDATTGNPLPGANVLLKGTSMGASSDLNGNYSVTDVPAGAYTIRVSYIGYTTRNIEITLKAGSRLTEDLKLTPVGVKGKEVVVTAQASGQNAAINQQLAASNIVNVVSAARIQELPDANAAESVGRLPGVYLLRSGGEGFAVAIRGLQPKYNEITIDGVRLPSTSSSDRGVDLSMISSNMLNGIEVYKTVTPDMDAAVLGGVVNFDLPEAKKSASGGPEIDVLAQGGYKALTYEYNPYKVSATLGDRFFDNRFGVLAQVIAEKANLTGDQLSAGYAFVSTPKLGQKGSLYLTSMTTSYNPSTLYRYDANLTFDYKLPEGKIDLMNFFSNSFARNTSQSQVYSLLGVKLQYDQAYSPSGHNVFTNLLDFQYNVLSLHMDAKIANAYSENFDPGSWDATFWYWPDPALYGISNKGTPQAIAEQATAPGAINYDSTFFSGFNQYTNFLKQRNLTGALSFEKSFTLSNLITAKLKFGGSYENTYRWYNTDHYSGSLQFNINEGARAAIIKAMPWLAEPPYNYAVNGGQFMPITPFFQDGYSYGNFLNGDYRMGPGVNLGLVNQAIEAVAKAYAGTSNSNYGEDELGSERTDYSGYEYRSAGYVMATVNIGPDLTVIPGVRYQGLRTKYTANIFFNASAPNPYPLPFPHPDSTAIEYHGYWLPDLIVSYKPTSWLDIHAAYTNTLTYPDYISIVPIIDIYTGTAPKSVDWNNQALKPAHSQNYDLSVSVYDNTIGLVTVDGFLKRIDDLIFSQGTYITDPTLYGLPSYTKSYAINTAINNPYRVDLWGAEAEWATHFWYLPGAMSGLVLSVNYTHIFSQAKYPYTITSVGPPPFRLPVVVDSFYTARLIDQPNDIVNLSLGYDYQGFSVRVSMINQSNVFTGPNFWPEFRTSKLSYVRWDLSAKQELPWRGLSVFLDLNDLNNASDTYIAPGNGYPSSQDTYGMTADVGLRWVLQ